MAHGTIGTASLVRQLGDWRGDGKGKGDPAYRQLAAALRLLIQDGRLPLGVRIPGEREMAQALGVSRTTLSAAFAQLRDEAYLQSRQGSGSITMLPGAAPVAPRHDMDDAGPDAINLYSASLPASEGVYRAYEHALTQLPAYLRGHGYEAAGLEVLREAIAAHYGRRGCPTDPEQIMVTSGAQSGLAMMLRHCAGPGDRVVIDHPTYHNAITAIERHHCQPVPVSLSPSGWDMDALRAALRQTNPRLAYIIADFHNPTGQIMDIPTRRALVEAAAQAHVTLLVDETMADSWLDMPPPPPVATFDPAGRVVTLGSTAKHYWGGLRIGWIRADRGIIAALTRSRSSFDLASPIIEQLAAAQLLAEGEAHRENRRMMLRRRRDRLAALLRRHLPEWRFVVPTGGFCLWVELPARASTMLAAVCASHGVRMPPGPRFGVNGALERFVRIPFTVEDAQIEPMVERLARAWAQVRPSVPRDADMLAGALEAEALI